MVTGGYEPSRDQMAMIVGAARDLYRVTRRWQAHSRLPGYPIDRGNTAALESLFRLERALNPRGLAWERPTRKTLPIACWPSEVAEGLVWVRNLLDLILERNRLQAVATMTDQESWLAENRSMPAVISIQKDELKALHIILQLLPGAEKLPADLPETPSRTAINTGPIRLSESLTGVMERFAPSVRLFGPGVEPLVLGKRKHRLTEAQTLVVQALLDAGEAGLAKAELEKLCGDAINVLKRLAISDPDWNSVIKLAGKKGNKYRIALQVREQGATEDREWPVAPNALAASPEEHSPVW